MKQQSKGLKLGQTCGHPKIAIFVQKYKKQPKTSQNSLFLAVFWSKRRDSNPRSPVPETGAIPPSLRLEIINRLCLFTLNVDFFALILYQSLSGLSRDFLRDAIAKKVGLGYNKGK